MGNSPVTSEFPAQRPVMRSFFMFSLICAWINSWVNNCEAGDLRCHCTQFDVIVMKLHPEKLHTVCYGFMLYHLTHILKGCFTATGTIILLPKPDCREAIIWTNAGMVLIGPWETNFNEILVNIQQISLKKCIWKCQICLSAGRLYVNISMVAQRRAEREI